MAIPFVLPSILPPGGTPPPPTGSWTNTLNWVDHYIQNGRFGQFSTTISFAQMYIGQHVFNGSWTDNLFNSTNTHYKNQFGTVGIIGSWTDNLFNSSNTSYASHFTESGSTYHNSFTNTLAFTQQYLTIPIVGVITNVLTFSYSMPSSKIYSRSYTTTLGFVDTYSSTGNVTASGWVDQLTFDGTFQGQKTLAPTHFTNTLNFSDLYPPAYILTNFTNTLSFASSTYTGKRNVLGYWLNTIVWSAYFTYGINPSRHWSDNLTFASIFSGVKQQTGFVIRYGDFILKLPDPELDNRIKPTVVMNKLIAMDGTTRTYLKRPTVGNQWPPNNSNNPQTKKSYLFDFIIDQYYRQRIKDFFDNAFDKLLIIQWQNQTMSVNLTTNPIVFETTSRYRMKFSLQFEGAPDGSWLFASNCVGNGF